MHTVLRRGPGAQINEYANGVHSDYGMDPQDFRQSVKSYFGQYFAREWQEEFDRPEIQGMVSLCFWRPVHMKRPLRSMPLALCDPRSV